LQKPKRFGTLAVPTVLRFRAMRFVIYFNDHEPAHVHIELPGAEVVAILDAATKTATIRDVRGGVRTHELARTMQSSLNISRPSSPNGSDIIHASQTDHSE
jgi:hypothetical protein